MTVNQLVGSLRKKREIADSRHIVFGFPRPGELSGLEASAKV
jgi:hypothetical protein